MAIIKLATNVPIRGSLRFVDYVEGKFGPQLKLNGKWNGQGDGLVYIPIGLEARLLELGLVESSPPEGDSTTPTYRVTDRGAVIEIVKREEGKAKITQIERVGGAAPASATSTEDTDAHGRDQLKRLEKMAIWCAKVARESWPDDWDQEAISRYASTILIKASDRVL